MGTRAGKPKNSMLAGVGSWRAYGRSALVSWPGASDSQLLAGV